MINMPSVKPKCPNCGPISFDEIKYECTTRNGVGPGTAGTGSANNLRRLCKKCGAKVEF